MKARKKKKTKPPRRLSGALTEAAAQRLGFEYEDLAAADGAAGLTPNLAKYLERHPRLRVAFERGQFLRNLKSLASIVMTVSEAAHKLGLQSGEALREILDTDAEAGDLWSQKRLDTIIDARQALLTAAKEGNHVAIRAVENYLREEKQQAGPAADLQHLSQKEIAELFDVSRVTLNEWQSKHGLSRNADRSYNLAEVIRWYGEFAKRKIGGKILPADKLRDLKAEEKSLDLAQRRGQLLEREAVVAGFLARWQMVVGAFGYKRRELSQMVHGQTIERIEEQLGRFFEDLQRSWLSVPEFLQLPPEAAAKLAECLQLCAEPQETEGGEQKAEQEPE